MKSYRRILTSLLLLGVLVFSMVPIRPAYADGLFPAASIGDAAASAAQGGLPVADIGSSIRDTTKNITTKIGEVLKNAALVAIKNALSAFLGRMAYDTAVYISSGGQGQDSLVFKQSPKEYFSSVGDAALGGLIEGFATGAGLDAAGLCNPGDNFRINLTIGLETNFGQAQQPYKPACTLTELTGNWKEAYSDPKFSDFLALQFDSTANPLGISMEVENLIIDEQAKAKEAALLERTEGEGFKAKQEQIAKTILTPGSLIKEEAADIKKPAVQATFDTIGNPVVDAINIFTSTLINKLITRVQDGLANIKSGTSLAGLLGGKFSGTVSGRAAAEETYANLRQTVFGTSGTFDVTSELVACDPSAQTINNCAMGATMQTAVQENWTVQEFIDFQDKAGASFSFANDKLVGKQIAGSEGINTRGIILLKKFRIVPVGWQVAADYINGITTFNDAKPTLKQLADCYNYCGNVDPDRKCDFLLNDLTGAPTNYSPFCKLIDPNWVLKAPQNFCQREAPGPIVVDQQAFDNDSSESTQQSVIISRLNYCADSRGCIQEGNDGSCVAYGYCMAEKRVYRFAGESCQEEYSSCQTFTDENGNDVSYVKNSLNYNDCATDPGCQWYCTSKNEAGEFNCASPTSTYVSCSEDVANNEASYGLAAGSVDLNPQAACGCTVKQTCQVPAGSSTGDNDGDGLRDNSQCKVTNTDSSESICTLSDNCGANSPNFDVASGKCTCTVTNSGSVAAGQNRVDIGIQTATGASGVQTCTLADEDASGSADSCTAGYSTFSSAPVCEMSGANKMNCGETCNTTAGGTCTNNLGNICTDGSATDGDAAAGKCRVSDKCSLATGQFKCTSANGNTCVLGTIAEKPAVKTDTIYFDQNVKECSSGDADCKQYIRTKSDTNLLPNALFNVFDANHSGLNDGNGDSILTPDGDGDDLAFCTDNGKGCRTSADCNAGAQCNGWLQDGSVAYVLDGSFTSAVTPDVGTNYLRLALGSGTFAQTVNTGQPLKNRTFTFAYRAMTTSATCDSVAFTIGSADGSQTSAPITAAADGADYKYNSTWQNFVTTFTFPDITNPNQTAVKVSISAAAECDINIGAAALVEDVKFNGFTDYSTNNVAYLNGETLSCQPDEVGCELYTPKGFADSEGIPGTITNPNSSACVNADGSYNYGNPSCSQCNGNAAVGQSDDYFAGCDFYQEVELTHTAPITTDAVWLSAQQRQGVMGRSGKYCAGDSSRHCLIDSDCGPAGSCVEQLSIVPTSGQQCPVAAVGCEQYTNLSSVEAGGEGLEYYTQLKQCVKKDDQHTAVFYTFEGSDVAGVQVEDHTLKVNQAVADGRPCTNLNLQSENFNADCADSTFSTLEQATWDCGPDGDIDADGQNNEADETTNGLEYGVNADCRQYVTDAGNIFYRYESQVIEASDDCTPLRNANDNRVYFALPQQSNSCIDSYVGCREYKGTHSGSEATIVDESFTSNSTEQWSGATSTSNESILQAGYSLQLHDASAGSTINTAIRHALFTTKDGVVTGQLHGGNTYVLTFWAKTVGAGTLSAALDFNGTEPGATYYFTNDGSSTDANDRITLDPNQRGGWQYYEVGPIVLPEGENVNSGDEYLLLQFNGDQAFIDTIQLSESDSQFLIQNTARSCNNFEGCRLYQDRNKAAHYLKSFLKLCQDSAVGCEAMVATQNSKNPYTSAFNVDNEYAQDDVVVQPDQPVTLVYNKENLCSANVMGCMEVGLPDVDERTGQVNDFASRFFLNQPDDYSSTLCEQPQLSCRAYTSDFDGTVYFKDPGDKVCELKEYSANRNVFNGWFKKDSQATQPDCPVQYNYTAYGEHYASQPLGGVCNSNSIKGNDNKVGRVCNADVDCYPSGWTNSDPTPRCISTIDDDVDVNTTDSVDLRNIITDFGWAGNCPDGESGCSEYTDPYSPNIKENNGNWSFEDDVRDDNGVYYDTGVAQTGFPDYWTIPNNVSPIYTLDTNGDGVINAQDAPEYTRIDIDADGTADFGANCTADAAQITSVSGDGIVTAEGGSALKLGAECAIENTKLTVLRPDKTYTIQARVKMDKVDLGNAAFSVGIQYYVPDGDDADSQPELLQVDDLQLFPVANRTVIPSEGGSDDDGKSYWYRFQGNIGVNTTAPIPIVDGQLASFGRVFIANNSSKTIYFDAVSFKENDKYYYLDYTVDGTTEHEQTSGNTTCLNQDTNEGEITSDGGCVAFRDTTSDSQDKSQDGLDCTPCLVSPNSDACRYVADACDTNVVLTVHKDRQCSEWLSCLSASLVPDANGNMSSQCFETQGCSELDENGNCARPVPKIQPTQLSLASDEHYTSADGDAGSLDNVQNKTGYSKIGVTWNNVLFCNGGPNDGNRCTSAADCVDPNDASKSGQCVVPFSSQGYYPYGSMAEVGKAGAQTGGDLIELNDFEDLTCAGGLGDAKQACIVNATNDGFAGNCFTNNLSQKIENNLEDDLDSYQDLVYIEGQDFSDLNPDAIAFCPNDPKFGVHWPFGKGNYQYSKDGWQPLGGANIFVTQFQNFQNCEAPCNDINLNNVLQIGLSSTQGGSTFSGGVGYDLQDNIAQSGTYALSLDARYPSGYAAVGEATVPSAVSICLQHYGITDLAGNPLEKKDCFVQGYGMADIVFAVDTSATMGEEIDEVAAAVPGLANQLAQSGIDAKFALVDMDKVGGIEDNYLDLNFTGDINNSFIPAVTAMQAAQALVDPWSAITAVAGGVNNNDAPVVLRNGSLNWRPGANHYLILVTDTEDELSNRIGETEALNAALSAELSVFVVTSSENPCAGGDRTDPCTSAYEDLTGATQGGVYNFTDPAGATYSDWVTNTTIITDIFTSILKSVDVFQFDSSLKNYTLGPIVVENNKLGTNEVATRGITTQLEFLGSDGTPFQLDNVSLLPVLDVNKELSPLSRQCRAYPTSDALQCDFSLPNGTRFVGWKGYCLEADPSNKNNCITWWPTDALTGEASIVQREADGYTGRSSVFYCLLAKGLQTPGFCNVDTYSNPSDNGYRDQWGKGVLCSGVGNTCGAAANSCFQGADYVLADTPNPFGAAVIIDSPEVEHDAIRLSANPYSEVSTRDGGQCVIMAGATSDVSCSAWDIGGSCSDSDYVEESACEDNGGTWTSTVDIMRSTRILATGVCENAGKPRDIFDGGDYYNNYADPLRDQMTEDKYCFYNVDGTGNAEVRSTRSCSTTNDCTRAPTTADTYQCGRLGCVNGFSNKSCSFRGNECTSTPSAKTNIPYSTRPMSWQMPDPADGRVCFGPGCEFQTVPGYPLGTGGDWFDHGVIVRLPANELLRNIHASEMQTISFNPGSAGFGGGAGAESPYWGQMNGSQTRDNPDGVAGLYDNPNDVGNNGEIGNIWLSDLKTGAFDSDASGDFLNNGSNCYTARDGGLAGVGCRMWGLWDSDMQWSNYAAKQLPKFGDGFHGYDLVYTFNWSNFNFSNSAGGDPCNASGDNSSALNIFDNLVAEVQDENTLSKIFNSGCLDDSIRYMVGPNGDSRRNPWAYIQEKNPGLWDDFYIDDVTDTNAKMVTFDGENLSGYGTYWPSADDQNGDLALDNHDGGNVMSFYVDFNEEGYIQAVYTLVYFGARYSQDTPFEHALDPGNWPFVETTYEAPMHLDIQTRESCLIVGEAVASNGNAKSWADRLSEGTYEISYGTSNAYSKEETYEPYGSIAPQDSDPILWDFFVNDPAQGATSWSALGVQPAVAMKTDAGVLANAGHPLACIGSCGQTSCVANPDRIGTNDCSSSAACSTAGSEGICMGVGDTTISNNGTDGTYTNQDDLQDQVDDTIGDARNRLKHVFARLDNFYQLDFKNESVYTDRTPNYWLAPNSLTQTIYDQMTECATDDGQRPIDKESQDEEYCGVYPTVTNIRINDVAGSTTEDYKILDGQTVTLKFDANVDGQQTPLNIIYIDYGDRTSPVEDRWEAAATTHIYTHEYSCDVNNDKLTDGALDGFCKFKPKITLIDNWDFCSGEETGRCVDHAEYTNRDACVQAGQSWLNGGDHRYNSAGGSNYQANCSSYDEPNLTILVDASN